LLALLLTIDAANAFITPRPAYAICFFGDHLAYYHDFTISVIISSPPSPPSPSPPITPSLIYFIALSIAILFCFFTSRRYVIIVTLRFMPWRFATLMAMLITLRYFSCRHRLPPIRHAFADYAILRCRLRRFRAVIADADAMPSASATLLCRCASDIR